MRQYFQLVTALAVIVLLGGTADPYDANVYQAQQRLAQLGYNPGPLDGFWGKQTETALRKFQLDKGLSVTGELDEPTKTQLGWPEAPGQPQASKPDSRPWQETRGAIRYGRGGYVVFTPTTSQEARAVIPRPKPGHMVKFKESIPFYGGIIIGYEINNVYVSDSRRVLPSTKGFQFLIIKVDTNNQKFTLPVRIGFREIFLLDTNHVLYESNGVLAETGWITPERSRVNKEATLTSSARYFDIVFEVPLNSSEMILRVRDEERILFSE